jgi:hypothetical protein
MVIMREGKTKTQQDMKIRGNNKAKKHKMTESGRVKITINQKNTTKQTQTGRQDNTIRSKSNDKEGKIETRQKETQIPKAKT